MLIVQHICLHYAERHHRCAKNRDNLFHFILFFVRMCVTCAIWAANLLKILDICKYFNKKQRKICIFPIFCVSLPRFLTYTRSEKCTIIKIVRCEPYLNTMRRVGNEYFTGTIKPLKSPQNVQNIAKHMYDF